ncbi:MAG: VOC family protein [Armatimonadetes bacterium]|nr:VOC family protein [Armatimonadota bacterium]
MATEPLDVDGLLAELDGDDRPWQGLSPLTRIGHVHLHVADVHQAVAFYRDGLGFDLMLGVGRSAAFLSAGGYHHHVGLNTWAGEGAPRPPADAAGRRCITVVLPDEPELGHVIARLRASKTAFEEKSGVFFLRDPSGNAILLTVGKSAPSCV